ncbi:unnamed protein product, partial [Scytosiphon promiscuus]
PYFLGGTPLDLRVGVCGVEPPVAPHTANGPGLHKASTGNPSSFTIRLGGDNRNSTPPEGAWNIGGSHFVYVSIVSTDHVFSAVVDDNGDGTLTATYTSSFPGAYLVFVQEVDAREPFRRREENGVERARPIRGSPFLLTITGDPTVDTRDFHVCGAEGYAEDISSTFWRTGSWVTSKYANAEHGVLRDGWVFQPSDCVHDTFNHSDIMLLAGLEEPTWLLVAGNSVQRGVFQTLVDLALAAGQKDEFDTSVIKKCWGMADVQIGQLRLTYQDLRLYEIGQASGDSTVCHGEKLAANSTAEYISSSERYLRETIFQDGGPWPSAIMAPSHMVDENGAPNLQINVLLSALPAGWDGRLIMMEHMAGLGHFFDYENPTAPSLAEVNPRNQLQEGDSVDRGLGRMEQFQSLEPRLTFMSVFPMYQSRLFDGEFSLPGKPCFGCSAHYHYVSASESPEAWHGAKMVHSDITEMLANIFIAKAVGTKAALHQKAARLFAGDEPKSQAQPQLCADCPAQLLPFHVKAVPDLTCEISTSLAGDATMGAAWGGKNCPLWCYEDADYMVFNTKSVRMCRLEGSYRE